jgi:histidyl-tRNA synthetase
MFPKVKGVTDNFFDMTYWSQVIKKIEAHLQSYNFSEIEIPILEHMTLFERGLGFETDVVSKQMFVIQPKDTDAHDKKDLICLRPEATAGTMRAFLQIQHQVPLPARVYCYGSMFRYERPQKGRLRQFHQMNFEILGGASIFYDAQCIAMLHTLFAQEFCIKNMTLKLNFLGESSDRKEFGAALSTFLKPKYNELCTVCQTRLNTNPLRILDCKSETCQNICSNAPKLADFFSEQTQNEWQQLQQELNKMNVPFTLDSHLVRGLDYYNKTVFEFVCSSSLGAQNSFCGGGRYDGLAEQLGSKSKVPALGCGIGMERLIMILQEQEQFKLTNPAPLLCVIPLESTYNSYALQIADLLLKQQNHRVEVLLDDTKIKHKMKQANELHASWALLLGDEEIKNNTITLKNMVSGEQQVINQGDLIKKLS